MKWFAPLILLIILFPVSIKAEIATVRDWIGLFETTGPKNCNPSDTAEDCRNKTVNGTSWAYTSSCTKTPGTTPKLSDSPACNLMPDPSPETGTFQYRMYANEGGKPEALIAVSKEIRASSAGGGPAGDCPVQNAKPRVQDGLISAPEVSNNFGNPEGACVISDNAAFAPYKIPSYDDLKSLYYTQAKETTFTKSETSCTQSSCINLTSDHVYFVTGDFQFDGNIPGGKNGLIFVEGRLEITAAQIISTPNSGLIFVVKGDVVISALTTRIDAVIISSGKIYTADGCTTANSVNVGNDSLTINGSLVSLEGGSIVFCRTLDDNALPAEIINQQPKYLVLFRDMFSNTLQKWTELQ